MNTRLNAIYSWLLENRSTSSYIDGSPSQYENQGITREQGWVQEIKTGTKARKSRCACQPSGRIKLRQGMSSCQPSYMEKVQKWGPGRGERRICRRLASWRARDCQAPGMLLVLRHKDGYWHVRAHETCGRSFCKTFNQESSFVSGSQIKGRGGQYIRSIMRRGKSNQKAYLREATKPDRGNKGAIASISWWGHQPLKFGALSRSEISHAASIMPVYKAFM